MRNARLASRSRRSGWKVRVPVALAAALLCASGCAYYTLSGGLPGHIGTVGVDYFENATLEVGAGEILATAVGDELVEKSQFRYASARIADAIIRGSVLQVVEEPLSYTGEQASEYQVLVIVRAEAFDQVRRRALWSGDDVRGMGTYDATAGLAARDEALRVALADIARQIIDGMLTGW